MWYNKLKDVETEELNMDNRNMVGDLGINTDVIEKMVSLAALEVDGVAAMANRSLDITGMINSGSAFKPAKITVRNGVVSIDVYISVKDGVKVKEVAETVQINVKDKVQDMTGNAITNVNVHIADLVAAETEAE